VWGRRDLIASLDVPKVLPQHDTPPERLETGTLNHEGIAGAAAAVDFLASLTRGTASRRDRLRAAFKTLETRGQALLARAWAGLSSVGGVRLFGPPPSSRRTPTFSFAIDGIPADTVARRLAERAIFASSGDFYASTVIERLGYARDGLVRAGCACYTTETEVDRLIEAVRGIAKAR
jgi:selenocysteine lyase/cysteine desulfurase